MFGLLRNIYLVTRYTVYMDFKDNYAPESEKLQPKQKNKIILPDRDYLLIDAINRLADVIGVRK